MGLVHAPMTDDTPLYLQVEARLRQGLAIGTWPADQALPPERQLAEDIGVSRRTLRKALQLLEEQGAIIRKRGSGTYAATLVPPEEPGRHLRLPAPPRALTSFTEELQARGWAVSTTWLLREITPVTPDEAMALAISPTARVARLKRIRYADLEPIALEHTVLPEALLPDPLQLDGSLYAHFDRTQARPVRAMQHIRAAALSAEAAQALNLPLAAPALVIRRVTYQANGRPLEYTHGHYQAARYDLVVEVGGGS